MNNNRYSRQSFLGADSELKISSAIVGIVGLGGGGSHISQQFAHLGFQNIILFDADTIEDTNLNRTVGATEADVLLKSKKVAIAKRTILSLQSKASVRAISERWQNNPVALRECDIVLGCVDSFAERRELEILARRYLIPYIDIGMTVKHVPTEPPRMSGQIFLSMPGCLCMTCVGILSEENLTREAEKYGDAGERPQVVWANGVLASTAVGITVDIITGWSGQSNKVKYIIYDGNTGTIYEYPLMKYLSKRCTHYPDDQVGDPIFRTL